MIAVTALGVAAGGGALAVGLRAVTIAAPGASAGAASDEVAADPVGEMVLTPPPYEPAPPATGAVVPAAGASAAGGVSAADGRDTVIATPLAVGAADPPSSPARERREKAQRTEGEGPTSSGDGPLEGAAAYTGATAECDEVACLAQGERCCPGMPRAAPSTTRSGAARAGGAETSAAGEVELDADTTRPPAASEALPARPGRGDVMRALSRAHRRLVHCAEGHGLRGTVTLELAISPYGAVDSLRASAGGAPFEACASSALAAVELPPSQAGVRVSYPVVVR
jgi:hypothetical protein